LRNLGRNIDHFSDDACLTLLLQARYLNLEKLKMHASQYTNNNVGQVKLLLKALEKCLSACFSPKIAIWFWIILSMSIMP